ncbi:uncharacterized protein FA14DRAFT_159626 [Meira miltonrushii]|uniref:Shugoshin C-terminal domain-containing protein n=1 Tax=Meira miltonrushii TaxID=1280837 RepID=A0A316VJB4_9BASI|nr:uncharacterized protein FA14DRAFT_159626 [Meira miltonrushii]PWN37699.1 hypothetical protein FA14DRAFT_159626 [Meira miltonrushii]
MAPATRRSSGFGSHANSPSNLDHILEHFNQFKRKHITQNRDIIKTNALAQLRIKELEEKVLGLEAEKTQIELERHRMKARLERAEKAVICIRQGWQLIGAGMTAVASIDGFEKVTEQQQAVTPSSALLALQQHQQKSHIRPSTRVVLDPNALPGGVARNVARPPEADLADLAEEESMELEEQQQVENVYVSDAQFENQGQITLEEPEVGDDRDSDNGELGDPVSFAGDGEDTVRLQTDLNDTIPHIHEEIFRQENNTPLTQSNLETEQQSNYHLDLPGSTNGQRDRVIQRMTSMDSLSSFADDEEIELSTDDEGGHIPIPNRAPTPVSNGSTRSQNGTVRTKTPRKRKTPSSPEDARGPLSSISASSSTTDLHQQDTISASQSEAEMDEENSSSSSNGTRASRRSSVRDRKSVNYALPKLNTKMRKPDPVDLIPAIGSQRKKRQGSMQAGLNGDEISEMNGENSEQEEEPKRRMLKGKNEAASTGNLREIRKLHQEKAQNDESLSPNREQDKQEDQSEMETSTEKTIPNQDERQQSDSPRRRSSRQSLGRRSSSSMTSENGGTTTNQQKSEEGRSARDRSSSPEDRKVIQGKDNQAADYTLPGMQKSRQSASKLSSSTNGTSTPKWRSMSGGMSSASSQSLGPSGTPIPKPTIRTGQQGTIKALNKAAGRIQKPISSVSGLSNGNGNPIQQQQQQKRVVAPFANGARATSDTQSQSRILGASAKANSTARSVSGSSATSSSSSSATGPSSQSTAGDPTKRNSLHAAMTWHDVSSASQQN